MSISFEDKFNIEKLNKSNIFEVWEFCENNTDLWSQPFSFFERASLGDSQFNQNFTLIARLKKNITESGDPIVAFFMGTTRPGKSKRKTKKILKFCVVKRDLQRKGLGSYMLAQLMQKFKESGFKGKFEAFCSPPDYWFVGVPVKFTPCIHFLKKNGFKRNLCPARINLQVNLTNPHLKYNPEIMPEITNDEIRYEWINEKNSCAALKFIEGHFNNTWKQEAQLSMKNKNPSTILAINNSNDEVIGFATCAAHFKNSFGPTGVNKEFRGKGIGGTLLKYTMFYLRQQGNDKMYIEWVGVNTTKYYAKSANAFIDDLAWPMSGRIK